ncbi:barstar family protein [Pectobacterium carotovorum]|uniref:barstar family protein n=1 Tax=Pectobacterium carotovorum TaxID=554 RepID=UPI0029D49076|nr:barstar family protein [Pectobacterium carotovorum]MDX6917652.1 barstar family protein [Pectobacterium carotovorum]
MSLNFIQMSEVRVLINRYEENGCVIINVNFNWARNVYDVFDGIKRTLPLDPPLYSKCNFDALSDSIFGGLDSLGESEICVFLVGVKDALKNDRGSYDTLLDIFSDNESEFENEGKKILFFIS